MQYSIIQKSQLEGAQRLDGEGWFKYIRPVYDKRKKLKTTMPQGRGLVFTIDSGKYKRLADLIQKVVKNVVNAEQIFGIARQLNDKTNPDEKIDDMISELRAASCLIDSKYKEIEYQKKGLDFKCVKNGKRVLAEVKFFRGPDFKTQEKLPSGGYRLTSDELVRLLERKLKQARIQFSKHDQQNECKHLLILVTSLLEAELEWCGDKVKEWCDEQNQKDKEIKAIFLTKYGNIYQ